MFSAIATAARFAWQIFVGITFLSLVSCLPGSRIARFPKSKQVHKQPGFNGDLLSRCKLQWRNATLDHYSWGTSSTFAQRYFICDEYWSKSNTSAPIFFYLGNEADVTLYLNNTGLMWESAESFGALLVFAEHRYYGLSKPNLSPLRKHMGYLSAEQAMADYAELISELQHQFEVPDAAVIGFGGSYGGMLASWFRMKYPHLLDGAIAGSAPIWNFFGEVPAFNDKAFAQGVTYDATPAGGAEAACAPNVRRAWKVLADMGASIEGREAIRKAVGLCEDVPLDDSYDLFLLRNWLRSAWDFMAMGNFPYPSAYILNGDGQLPAYPVRVACKHLAEPDLDGAPLLAGMAAAAGVFYNHSGDAECFDFRSGANPETDEDGEFWDYQWCTEMVMPFSTDGETDMFWEETFSLEGATAGCQQQWGVTPRPQHATIEWGGRRILAASNIVFSNGLLDPWHGGGVLKNLSDSLLAIIIPEGAHHLDLMFSNPDDPQSVKWARDFERAQITKWVRAKTVAVQQRQAATARRDTPAVTKAHAGFVELPQHAQHSSRSISSRKLRQ